MAGNVALNRSGDTLNGGRLVIDLNTGISSVDGRAGGGGRVSGSFSVPRRD
jgi:lipopolysaccharide export system protein LptA